MDGQITIDEYLNSVDWVASQISAVFSSFLEQADAVGDCIANNPFMLTFTLVPLVGLGVGLFKRLIRIR